MLKTLGTFWNRLFLTERSSLSLSLFRIAAALATGLHVLPSFLYMHDNYLTGAFKEYNVWFFTSDMITFVWASPDWLIWLMAGIFVAAWFCFLIGFLSQASCIVMILACYYFYALNALHIGTLSWDILLVVLFLMAVTPYHGDHFSIDSLRREKRFSYKKKRPFFVQRLLQLEIASIYFYTALYKVTAEGNWLTDNPMYYLYNYPPEGVTKNFLFRDFIAAKPELCYVIGISVLTVEFLLPFLLFMRRTRPFGIAIAVFFHIALVLTLHVPTIFFFLFIPQLFLFINPDHILQCIKRRRTENRTNAYNQLLYDGDCVFCRKAVKHLMIMDIFGCYRYINFRKAHVADIHPALTQDKCVREIHLVDTRRRVYAGYYALREMAWRLPMMVWLAPLLYFPGAGFVGSAAYRFIAANRFLCQKHTCFSPSTC